jgi:DNA helicase-2/ATP-dependent DNA helicase PcrA
MSTLNDEQKRAAQHIEGPALILAGAGSGKTRVITERIAYLLSLGVPAHTILAVTFTNKAAEEMRKRVALATERTILATTFHSLGARILREEMPNFTIYDEDESEKLLKHCIGLLGWKEERGDMKTLRGEISDAKNRLLSPEEIETENPKLAKLYALYRDKLKEIGAADFDDLLLLPVQLFRRDPALLNKYQERWRFILIDEYQDTNFAQHTLVRLLAGSRANVFAVGDPDQSIYSWRGASLTHILGFEGDFPGAQKFLLEQNYRSRSNILNAANGLIRHNTQRFEKELWSERGPGEKIRLDIAFDDRQEAELALKYLRALPFPLSDCVIFYRTNAQSRIFEDLLLRERVPYVIIGGLSFYARKEVRDLLAFLKMVVSDADLMAFHRTIYLPRRGLGEAALEKIEAAAGSLPIVAACRKIVAGELPCALSARQREGLTEYLNTLSTLRRSAERTPPLHELLTQVYEQTGYLNVLKDDPDTLQEKVENVRELISAAAAWEQEKPSSSLHDFLSDLSLRSSNDHRESTEDALRLMTLHHGKGLEFSGVFLVGMEEDLFPHLNTKETQEGVEEERRLCYVGMTRAKERLFLSAAKRRFVWGSFRTMTPSRFLAEIPPEYLARHVTDTGAPSEEGTVLCRGDTVTHRDFGQGTIEKVYETSLGPTYDVAFSDGALRSLVAKFAKLRKMP